MHPTRCSLQGGISGALIIYLLAMDAHAGGKLCSGLTDVIFATVVTSNIEQQIFGFTRHILINIKSLLKQLEAPVFG